MLSLSLSISQLHKKVLWIGENTQKKKKLFKKNEQKVTPHFSSQKALDNICFFFVFFFKSDSLNSIVNAKSLKLNAMIALDYDQNFSVFYFQCLLSVDCFFYFEVNRIQQVFVLVIVVQNKQKKKQKTFLL